MSNKKVKLVICWHMHQPNYIDASNGQYVLPWTYLHAIKDYVDMAAHLENVPQAKAVINFAPVLLDQLSDYVSQIDCWRQDKTPLSDPMLDALISNDILPKFIQSPTLMKACLRANNERLIERHAQFSLLSRLAKDFIENDTALYMSEQFVVDLLVWYNLAWMAETLQRSNLVVKRLKEKKTNYSMQDRVELLELIGDQIGSIVPRYKRLAETEQVELAFSPFAHPIIPLLIDFKSARQASENMPLPESETYPGGIERSLWHFKNGIDVFEKHFGFKPVGCWPSEGGLCDATIEMSAEMGIKWLATGESVLRNSIHDIDMSNECIQQKYQLNDIPVICFFRDDGLSDLIGFDYSNWHADDAVNNLIHHVENIANSCPEDKEPVVSVILDGENAWEYYPENAYHFLSQLYKSLSEHKSIELTTFEKCCESSISPYKLSHVVAGSWVYGTFSTWMGDKDKNRGWDLLCDAKRAYDESCASGSLNQEQLEKATMQLAICEGSDWFWWFGDYNPGESVSDFDRLFRLHLRQLYILLNKGVPSTLLEAISAGNLNEDNDQSPDAGGVMRHGSAS